MNHTAWITIALNLMSAFVYYAVGRVVSRRPVSEDAMLARTAFAGWWYALAVITVGGAITTVIGAAGAWSVAGLVAYIQVVILVILVALGGLLYYFVYLFTGKRNSWRIIAAAYAAYFVAFLYYLAAQEPTGLQVSADGGQELVYANDMSDSTFASVLGLLLLLPVIGAALGYFSLIRKVPTRSGKFRIGSVAGAFIFWFGASIVAGQVFDVTGEPWWRLASTAISLSASLLVYIAFAPPKWLQNKLELQPYDAKLP